MPARSAASARRWVRLVWNPEAGVTLVQGDSTGILGIPARRLIDASEPLLILPQEIIGALSGGVPEIPVFIHSATFTGTICPSGGSADITLFGDDEQQGVSGVKLDELGAGVVSTDRNGVITLWNKAMSSIFRVPERHAVGKRLQDVLISPLLYSWENVIQLVLDGRQVTVECRPEGQRRVESTFASGGAGVVGTCFDTTESFQAERRLKTSRRMNQAYFHSVSTGLVLFDKDYRILVANRAFGRIFGLLENLLGIHLHEILPRESFVVLEEQIQPVFIEMTEMESSPRVVRFILPDGTEKVITQTTSSIAEDSGEVFYAVGMFEDNTRSVMMEEELKRCRDRIRQIGSLSRISTGAKLQNLDNAARLILECFSARAVAIYLFEPMTASELAGKSGDWPDTAPETFSDLRLSSLQIESMQGCQLSGDETGILSSWFKSCLVFPIEIERRARGYIIAADAGGAVGDEVFGLATIASRLLALSVTVHAGEMEKEQLHILLDRQRRLAGTILATLDVPAALFQVDWSVIQWNRAMEDLTGIPAEVALNRAEMGANLLFDALGGISTAQRLARKGLTEFPEAWEVTSLDGTVTRCAWRLSGAESAERGNIEPVMILVGTLVGDRYSMKAAREAADMYQAIGRATSGLLSATTRSAVAETAAGAFLAISGAARVELKLRGIEPVSRASIEVSKEAIHKSDWKLVLETDTLVIGECLFAGGRNTPLLGEFSSNVARTYTALEKNAIGQRFAVLADRTAGKFLITDSGGRVLLSTWLEATEGSVTGMSLHDIFESSDKHQLIASIQGVLRAGRLDLELTPRGGSPFRAAAVAINGHDGEPLLFWWPISSPAYVDRIECGELARKTATQLNDFLSELSASIARGFGRIRDTLNPDNPVAATLNTARYAFDSIGRTFLYQRLLRSAWSHLPEKLSPEILLDAVTNRFLTDAIQPPDFTIIGEMREVAGDFDLLTEIIAHTSRIFCPGAAPRISAEVQPVSAIPHLGKHGHFSGHFLKLQIRTSEGHTLHGVSERLQDGVFDLESGLDPSAELSLLSLALKLAGGHMLPGDTSGSLIILLPCWS